MGSPERKAAQESSNPADHAALFRSMSENFTGVYLTMLSIIQGVALADLANVTFSAHAQFTIVHWIEVAVMLWTLIYVWNHFMGDALMIHRIPDLEDAVLLFGTGILELVANHAIVWGITAWLATLAMMFFGWARGLFYIRRQEESAVRDPVLIEMLRSRMRPILTQTLAAGTSVAALAIACGVTGARADGSAPGLRTLALFAIVIALCASLTIGSFSASFWRKVRHYAHTGEVP